MLLGRDREREAIDRLLSDARASRSGALVLRGEPGIGKSALLEHAVERADGMRVLSASGIEAESELPFAGLHQLLWPVLERAADLPEMQRAALEGAFGLSADAVPDRFMISLAVLALLTAVGDDEPLLCVVDDAHWLDRASGDALLFAARRLQADPVALLAATREGEGRRFVAGGLSELTVEGLPDEVAAALLDERLPDGVRHQLIRLTHGNPLALLELPRGAVRGPALGAGAAAAATCRSPRGSRRPSSLASARCRRTPGGCCCSPRPTTARTSAACSPPPHAWACPAARSMPPSVPGCSTPMASGCASATRSCARRSTAARRQASAAPPTPRWPRCSSASATPTATRGIVRPPPSRPTRRPRPSSSAPLSVREPAPATRPPCARSSARPSSVRNTAPGACSPRPTPRCSRAACTTWTACCGGSSRCSTTRDPAPWRRGSAWRWRSSPGSRHAAYEASIAAARAVLPLDRHAGLRLLGLAAESAAMSGYPDRFLEAADVVEELEPSTDDDLDAVAILLMRGFRRLLRGEAQAAGPFFTEALDRADALDEPRPLLWAGGGAAFVGDRARSRRSLDRGVALAREQGALGLLPHMLGLRGNFAIWDGRLPDAAADADEAVRLAEDIGAENARALPLTHARMAQGPARRGGRVPAHGRRGARAGDRARAGAARGVGDVGDRAARARERPLGGGARAAARARGGPARGSGIRCCRS